VRETLREVPYRARGTEIGPLEESPETLEYRRELNSEGSPSDQVAAGYRWNPGTELATAR
jgi:hypothetical protein